MGQIVQLGKDLINSKEINREIILRNKEEEQLEQLKYHNIEQEGKICANCQHFFKGQCRKSLDPDDYKDVSPLNTCGSFYTEDETGYIKGQKEQIKFGQRKKIKEEIYTALMVRDSPLATEKIVELFEAENYVFALRNDDKDEIWIYNNGIYEPNGISHIKEFVRKILLKGYTTHFANMVIDKIKIDNFIGAEVFFESANQLKDEIPLWNGVLNLKTRKLSHFEPHKIFFSKIPVDYKPHIKPDKTIEFFKDILEREEDIAVLQEWFGYCLLKDYPIEKAIMLYGKGRNGKGQLLELMKRFVGFDNVAGVSLNRLVDENSFNISELHNRLINIGGDIDGSYLERVGMFQQLTGNDLISAKRKFKTDIKFTNYAKLIFACNNLPTPGQTSEGFWDRWMLLKFPFKFVHQEIYNKATNEERKFWKIRKNNIIVDLMSEKEMSGLLNWALLGLDRLLEKGHFTLTKSTQDVKEKWLKTTNSLIAFCEETITEDYDSMVTKEDFRYIYNNWCKENNVESVSDKRIKNYLTKEMGVSDHREFVQLFEEEGGKSKNKQIYCWKGIKINQGIKDKYGFSTYIKKPTNKKLLDIIPQDRTIKINEFYEHKNLDVFSMDEEINQLKKEGLIAEVKPGEFIRL